MRRFQIILLLLVVIPLAALTFASVRLFNAEVDKLHLQIGGAVLHDMEQLTVKLLRHGDDVAARATEIVQKADGNGIGPLRCLHIATRCAVDAEGLVKFGAVFNSKGIRIYPSENELEQTFVEKQVWARFAPQLTDLVVRLQSEKSSVNSRSDRRYPEYSDLVKTVDGPAICAPATGHIGGLKNGRIYCAVMDVRVFQGAVIAAHVRSGWKREALRSQFEIIAPGGEVWWRSRRNLVRGGKPHVAVLKWPFDGLKISGTWEAGRSAYFGLPVIGLIAILFPGSFVLVGLAVFLYRQRVVELGVAQSQVERAAMISHELRTPLTNIRIYLEMIRGSEADDVRQLEANCQIIIAEIERLDSLIERTLYSVQNFGQNIRLNPQIKPDEVISTICSRFAPLIDDADAKVKLDLNASGLVNVDRWDLEQVLINLLDNARKHAPGSDILVISRVDDGYLLLDIVDQKKLLSSTGKSEDALDCEVERESCGFGLRICREIIGAYNGRLMESQHGCGRRYSASFHIGGKAVEGRCD